MPLLGALALCLFPAGCRRPVAADAPVSIVIAKGTPVREIARQLHEAGLITHPIFLRCWARLRRAGGPRPGLYQFARDPSAWKIWTQLLKGPPPVRVTFPEGWTSRQMADLLAQKKVVPESEFLVQVDSGPWEGYLFPDTYFFDQGLAAPVIVSRMTARFKQELPLDFDERAKALGLTPKQLVILASMVEREARVAEERPVIAGVFLNRLRKNWLLESCATVQYALGAWKPRLRYKDLAIESPYNTYRHRGLPPGPIGNPGRAALEAAAHPAQTEMMFFVAEGNGTHRFSRYYKDHLNAQKRTR